MKIPRRYWISRWDGSDKNFTKDCNGCEWYRKIEDKELCGWGVAFKYLFRTEKPRKCEVKNREQGNTPSWYTFKPSVEYLDELVLKEKQ